MRPKGASGDSDVYRRIVNGTCAADHFMNIIFVVIVEDVVLYHCARVTDKFPQYPGFET